MRFHSLAISSEAMSSIREKHLPNVWVSFIALHSFSCVDYPYLFLAFSSSAAVHSRGKTAKTR